ncbi:MAG: hypothetical protein A2W91_06015 [Bacteroidetes bacterium GWF2_38_335]|nr:MAG: hypothetical protein A2W91_06015 [Bacteroidetes bacterium GWF2_38_335]OFY81630.1 MAG: hypothetical protein A2281_11810 [Bacteroidetes bacterium RIFOXYA12_FULL_38_20]HBS88982.1 hypothetical protein [Bacteroidales bacterium]
MKTVIAAILIFSASLLNAQIGGKNTYEFLDLPNSARVASLGGNALALCDGDINMVFHNPSLLNESMDNHVVANYVNYFSDINFGYAAYAKKFKKFGMLGFGIHYINYGDFVRADETSAILGNFKASEQSLNVSWAKPLDSLFSVGATAKIIYSALDSYFSAGMVFDAGATYYNSKKLFGAAVVLKNFGTQFKSYTKGNYEPMPMDIQLGFSKKLRYAPFRFSVTAQNLLRWDMSYINTNEPDESVDPLTGEPIKENKLEKRADNFMKHFILGSELIMSKNFFIRLGYNYQRRSELKISTRAFTVGFSWGFGFRINKFHFSYGRATYHLAGPSNHFSISTSLSDFMKKAE